MNKKIIAVVRVIFGIMLIALGSIVALLNIFIAYTEWDKYKSLFVSK